MSPGAHSADLSQGLMTKERLVVGAARPWVARLSVILAITGGVAVGFVAGQFHTIAAVPMVNLEALLPEALLPDCGLPPEYCMEPLAKQTIRKMDAVLMTRNGELSWPQFRDIMTPFWTEDFEYVTGAFPDSSGLRQWHDTEYLSWNKHFPRAVFTQMIFLGDNATASTTTYGRVLWTGLFNGIEEPGTPVTIRITDFYSMDAEARIRYNYMMIDWADVFRQLGRPVLPPAFLPEGLALPPAAMYGVPAPISQFADPSAAAAAKEVVRQILLEDFVQQSEEARSWSSDLVFYGPVGFGMARGVAEYRQHFLAPLKQALGNASMDLQLLVCEDRFCGAHGWLYGDHRSTFLGFAPSNKRIGLRFGMHWRVEDGKAVEGWAIFDLPNLFHQLGMDIFQFAASMNSSGRIAPPARLDELPLV